MKLWTHPYDPQAESELDLAERQRWFSLVSSMLDDMPDSPQRAAACLAIGTPQTAGTTVERMAARAGISENTLLKSAAAFCERHGIHASPPLRTAWQAKLGRALAVPRA